MTFNEAMRQAEEAFDELEAESLARSEECLRDCGADDAETEALMQRYRAEFAELREQHLRELAGWMRRGCVALH